MPCVITGVLGGERRPVRPGVPVVGDVLGFNELGLEFEVMRMHGRRIADLHLRRSAPLAVPLPADFPEETTS